MKNNLFPKITLIISFVFFCSFLFIFIFLYKSTNSNYKESQLQESKWQNENSRRDKIKTLDNSIKIIEKERVQLETHFAHSSDIVPFLNTIEGLSSKVGTKAEVLSVDVATDHTGLMVSMKASGTFSSIYKFLTLLENSPYQLEFISTDMHKETGAVSADGKSTKSSAWNITFKMKLLSFVE